MLPEISLELLKKYDKAGPRYTSYPTAPHFSQEFSLREMHEQQHIAMSDRSDKPLSLYFHVPFCATLCLYCGCHTEATRDADRIATYMDCMQAELALFARQNQSTRKVKQIHFGGGTPTHAGVSALARMLEEVHAHFSVADDAEVACEVDPRQISADGLADLRRVGFNRISFGVQDLDAKVQLAIGRVQAPQMCAEMVAAARAVGFQSVNVDLIYGLPFQSMETQRRTLEFLIAEMPPDRLAVFNFAYLPHMKAHQRALDAAALPSPEEKLMMLKQSIDLLTAGGYEFIGMDHFAKPDDDLARAFRENRLHRNFQGYTTVADCDIFGFGVSSISQFAHCYSQVLKDERRYIELIRAGHETLERGIVLTAEDELRRDVIMQILCCGRIEKRPIEARHGIEFDQHFSDAISGLKPMVEDGFVALHSGAIQVTPLGRLFIRNLAMLFDAWLSKGAFAGRPQYSRTV